MPRSKHTCLLLAGLIFSVLSSAQHKEKDPSVVTSVERMPEFEGDMSAYIGRHLQYPEIAVDNAIEGKVVIKFIVSKTGTIEDISVVKSVHSLLDNASRKVIAGMPAWKPGMVKGEAVKTYYRAPIVFALDHNSFDEVYLDTLAGVFKGPRSKQFSHFPESVTDLDIWRTIRIPETVWQANGKLEGRVKMLFTVSTSGLMINPRVIKSTHPELEQYVIRHMIQTNKSPIWTPANKSGIDVNCDLIITFLFEKE